MKVSEIIARSRREKRNLLETEAYQVLESYGIRVPKFGIASTEEEVLEHSNAIGFPVVLKVISPQISHKSDARAVILNLDSDREVTDAFRCLKSRMKDIDPDMDLRGVLVSKMMPKGTELIIGMVKDPEFGPAVLFGLGGIFVEVLKDVSCRVVPIAECDAAELIREIKGYALLAGTRKTEPADIEALTDIILNISRLAVENPEIAELDLNPVLAYPNGACAVDARIILDSAEGMS